MRYGQNGGVKLLIIKFVGQVDAILTLCGGSVGPRVADGDVQVVLAQRFHNVENLGVAHVGAVFFEGEAQNQNV